MWDDEEALSELIHAFKVEARQRVRDDRARAPEDVAGLLDVIERRLFDPRFDVSALRRECRPSRATLWRFRAALGLNPKAYVNLRIGDAARDVVRLSSAPLSVIAEGFGFRDPELFSKWLKGQTGKSPSQLRAAPPRYAAPVTEPERTPATPERTIQRFRRLVLGGVDVHEAASWARYFRRSGARGAR